MSSKHELVKIVRQFPSSLPRLTRNSLWNCCQMPVHPLHQSLQLFNLSFPHLVLNHHAAASPGMSGFTSTACGPVLVDLWSTWKQWACAGQSFECGKVQTAHHILRDWTKLNSGSHLWGGQSSSLRISCQIKVLTSVCSCAVYTKESWIEFMWLLPTRKAEIPLILNIFPTPNRFKYCNCRKTGFEPESKQKKYKHAALTQIYSIEHPAQMLIC